MPNIAAWADAFAAHYAETSLTILLCDNPFVKRYTVLDARCKTTTNQQPQWEMGEATTSTCFISGVALTLRLRLVHIAFAPARRTSA